MSDIAFIGDRDTVWPFKALGAEVFFSDEHESVPRLVQEAARRNFGIIYVTEDVYESARDGIDKFAEASRPTFSIIPSVKGGRGVAIQILRDSVRKAMGAEFI